MDRVYKTEIKEPPKFFYGKEVEETPFVGLWTLFIVGNQSNEMIDYYLNNSKTKVEQLYFAANHSYNEFNQFEQLDEYINRGFNVTYEITVPMFVDVKDKLPDNANFHLMISLPMPSARSWKYRTTIKIDDRDKNRVNPGVWCCPLYDIMQKDNLTPWDEYGNDEVVE